MVTGSASRALAMMELIAVQPSSAPRVAAALGVHPRTARRVLNELVRAGWVQSTSVSPRVYRATLRPVASTWRLIANLDVFARVAPFARQIERQGFVCEIAMPNFDSVLALRTDDISGSLSGHLVPAHACAAGKALLANRAPWLDSVIASGLAASTTATVTEASELRRQCARIRDHGIALERDEWQLGRSAVAAALVTGDGKADLSLSVVSTSRPLSDVALAALANRVRTTAERLTALMPSSAAGTSPR